MKKFNVMSQFSLRKAGFTLSEVLITLAIIGIIAVLTVPNLITNYQKKQTIAKLKKAYAVLNQVVLLSYAENGSSDNFLTPNLVVSEEKVREFFNIYWLPYFKIIKLYETDELPYSVRYPLKALNGSNYNLGFYTNYVHGRVYFLTSDNIGYFIDFMDWDYNYDDNGNIVSAIPKYSSKQAIYLDINGISEPNTIGKDIFIFFLDSSKNIIKPDGADAVDTALESNCSKNGLGTFCAEKIIRNGWEISDDYPW